VENMLKTDESLKAVINTLQNSLKSNWFY
jgi:hypothetical protein